MSSQAWPAWHSSQTCPLPAPPPPCAVYLAPKEAYGLTAITLSIRDQTGEPPNHIIANSRYNFEGTTGSGYAHFTSLQALRARPGYLAGDTLVVRAEVGVSL